MSVRLVLCQVEVEKRCGTRTEVREGIPLRDDCFGRQRRVDGESMTTCTLPASLTSPTRGHLEDATSRLIVD